MKTALIDVGGGLRGVYAAGVLDYCLDEKVAFDLCIGISAGSANVAAYLAGQRGPQLPLLYPVPLPQGVHEPS